ncbi:MAG: hypothetical protein OHK0022_51170 [Roseiflexaceae bacterium]
MEALIDTQLLLAFARPWSSAHLTTVDTDTGLWVLPAEDAARWPAELLDRYLSLDRLTCCDLCLGMEICIGGRSWSGYICDHVWHLSGWFIGLRRVLEGGPRCRVETFVWDESLLVLLRDGDRLTLYDEHVRQRGRPGFEWSPITVDLWSFGAQLLAAGRSLERLAQAMLAAIRAQAPDRAALAALLAPLGDKPVAQRGNTLLALAILARELEQRIDAAELDRLQAMLAARGSAGEVEP